MSSCSPRGSATQELQSVVEAAYTQTLVRAREQEERARALLSEGKKTRERSLLLYTRALRLISTFWRGRVDAVRVATFTKKWVDWHIVRKDAGNEQNELHCISEIVYSLTCEFNYNRSRRCKVGVSERIAGKHQHKTTEWRWRWRWRCQSKCANNIAEVPI